MIEDFAPSRGTSAIGISRSPNTHRALSLQVEGQPNRHPQLHLGAAARYESCDPQEAPVAESDSLAAIIVHLAYWESEQVPELMSPGTDERQRNVT